MINITRKEIENYLLHKGFKEGTFIQAETLEAMVATFIWLLEDKLRGEVELEVEFCLNHYDLFDPTKEYDKDIISSLEEAYDIAFNEREGDDNECDCADSIDDLSDYYG